MAAGLNDTSCFEARQYYLTVLILSMYVYAAMWYACVDCNLMSIRARAGIWICYQPVVPNRRLDLLLKHWLQ